jgi:hypothetical protein
MFITVDNSQVHLVSNATRLQNYRSYSNNQPKERLINPKEDSHFVLLKAHYASEMIFFFSFFRKCRHNEITFDYGSRLNEKLFAIKEAKCKHRSILTKSLTYCQKCKGWFWKMGKDANGTKRQL